ncbi:MAG TPA: ABC transporter substrate-binding protein, partial [Casimicrobiaceae bacterium]|nr:ABC transporter substrate-binding protein [Casimicrobiaceae bacterium]
MKPYRKQSIVSTLLAVVLAGGIAHEALAQAGKPYAIRVAQQPQRWALEWYIASKKGWWQKIGLEPTMSTFASGAPEVAAGAAGSWDVGGAGSIPAVLGAGRYKLQTIAIADEEAAIITIMSTKDKADTYLKNPALLKGKSIPVPLNSTGHWGAAVCMEKKFKLKPSEWTFVNLSPSEINAAITSGRYDVTEAWAPNTYQLEATIDAK